MENQTRFDLNAAVENWRHELAAQPPLTPGDRRELETHLRDSLAELKARGLSDEESFWLARRRVGQPHRLAEEFVKADPAKVWRERFYWMAVALVGSYVFMTWKDLLATWLNPNNYGWVESFYLIPVLFLIGSVVVIRRGKIPAVLSLVENASPFSWKPAAMMFLILLTTVLSAYFRGRHLPSSGDGFGAMLTIGYNIGLVLSWLSNAWPPAVLVLILLFTTTRKTKAPKAI
ncbi:MAG TPA: permease prefix domain 1-containing protein [Verrucomicrobiae bacterium]|jgi:hypothetical protein